MNNKQKGLIPNTLGGLFWIFFGTGTQSVLQFIVLVILARLVSPDEFGVVNAAMIVVAFSVIFTQLGVGPALVQRPKLEERHLRTGFTLSLLMGVFLSLIIILLSPFIASFFRMEALEPVLRVVALVFPLQGISLLSESLLQRNMKFRQFAVVQVTSYLFGYGLTGITLGFMELGIWALVGAHVIQNVLKCVILLILQHPPKRLQLDFKTTNELLYFGGGFTAARIGNYFAINGDNLVVGRWLGSEALGLYGRAYQLIMMPANLFGQVLDKVLFPVMAKVQQEPQRLISAYCKGVSAVAFVTLPLTPFLIILAPEIILILLGKNWEQAILPFQILAVGLFFRTSYKISDSLVRAKGAVYRRAWRQWIYALAVFIGAFIGHYWGLTGVACGILGAICLNYLLMTQLSLKLITIEWKRILSIHIQGLALVCISFVELWLVVWFCRAFQVWAMLTIIISLVVLVLTLLAIFLLVPKRILGKDALWIYETFNHLVMKRIKMKVQSWRQIKYE